MTEWIAYPYKAPETDGEYLVTVNIIGCRVVGISYFRNGKFTESDNRTLAWMPLPDPYYRNKKTRTKSARYEEDDPARYPTEGTEEPVEYDRGIPVYVRRLDDLDKVEKQIYDIRDVWWGSPSDNASMKPYRIVTTSHVTDNIS